MTDHLGRLAARALGLAEAVRPRRTLFEPPPVVPEQPSRPDPRTEQRAPAPAAPAEETQEAETVVVRVEGREEATRPGAVESIAAEERLQVSTQPRETPASAPSKPPPSLPVRRATLEKAVAREETGGGAELPADSPVERGADVVAQRVPLLSTRGRFSSLSPEREPDPTPSVRVTIGRVEVRAVAPEQPVERRAKPPPRMSLDEYLSRGRSGAR